MSNMSYCRFRNTSEDFADCLENLYELEEASFEEQRAAERLYKQALKYIEIYKEVKDIEEED